MQLEISIGEALDKLSILHIKIAKIKNTHKLTEVNKEISSMKDIMVYMEKYKLFYPDSGPQGGRRKSTRKHRKNTRKHRKTRRHH